MNFSDALDKAIKDNREVKKEAQKMREEHSDLNSTPDLDIDAIIDGSMFKGMTKKEIEEKVKEIKIKTKFDEVRFVDLDNFSNTLAFTLAIYHKIKITKDDDGFLMLGAKMAVEIQQHSSHEISREVCMYMLAELKDDLVEKFIRIRDTEEVVNALLELGAVLAATERTMVQAEKAISSEDREQIAQLMKDTEVNDLFN